VSKDSPPKIRLNEERFAQLVRPYRGAFERADKALREGYRKESLPLPGFRWDASPTEILEQGKGTPRCFFSPPWPSPVAALRNHFRPATSFWNLRSCWSEN